MKYIILDVEFNGRRFASDLPMEVIEIGAVCLNEQLDTIDEYTAVVKPYYFSKLNKFIQEKTNIAQTEIDAAPRWPEIYEAFTAWLEQHKPYTIVTWGGEDMKRIVLDTRMHNLDDQIWLQASLFDLLKGYRHVYGHKNDVSVTNALIECGFEATEAAHRALVDARMTGTIFKTIYDKLDFTQRSKFQDVWTTAKERRLVTTVLKSAKKQNVTVDWPHFVEHILKDKPIVNDIRKMQELERYFAEKVAQFGHSTML